MAGLEGWEKHLTKCQTLQQDAGRAFGSFVYFLISGFTPGQPFVLILEAMLWVSLSEIYTHSPAVMCEICRKEHT